MQIANPAVTFENVGYGLQADLTGKYYGAGDATTMRE
jgi:hypothetical protein